MILENDYIKLRPVEPEDAAVMWLAEKDSTQWIQNGMCAPLSRHNIKEYALTYDADPFRAGQLRLIIEDKNNLSVIGIVDLFDISSIHRNAFVGIYIFPDKRGSGYASLSLNLLEDYALRLLNLRHLGAKIMADNVSSSALFEKCGYILRGNIPEWFIIGNASQSMLLYSKILGA